MRSGFFTADKFAELVKIHFAVSEDEPARLNA